MKKSPKINAVPVAAPPVATVAPPKSAPMVKQPPPVAMPMPPMGGSSNKLPPKTRHKHGARGMK